MELLKKNNNLEFSDVPDFQGWIGDARFGLHQLSNYFNKKKKI